MKDDHELGIADRISIINTLLQQDREEIRFHKNILFNATIVFISGFIGVVAYFINTFCNKNICSVTYRIPITAIWMLFGLYMIIFLFLRHFINDIRKCVDIRESYYKNLALLHKETPFRPLKSVQEAHIPAPSIRDDYLLGLLIVTFAAAIANSAAVYYLFTQIGS